MIGQLQTESGFYHRDVAKNSGSSFGDLVKSRQLIDFYKAQGRLNNIKLLWSAVGGTLIQSGTNPLQVSKAYSADSSRNDLTQATSLNQPYGVGQIQNLPMGLYNPNGSSRYMTHPAISFADNEAWSVSINLNNNGSNNILAGIIGKGSDTQSIVSIRDNSTSRIKFTNNSGSSATGTQSLNKIAGKNATITLVADGAGLLSVYVNGVFLENLSIATDFVFLNVVKAFSTTSREFFGNIKSYCIQSGALTASQVASEHAMLRSIYPEIPSVVIGSQTWAVDNFRAVATPMGNVIPNVTDNAAWAALTTPAWCSYNDPKNDAIYGKLYNWYAVKLLQDDIDAYNAANPSTPWGWRVPAPADFTTLATTLGGASVAGGKMKMTGTDYWNTPNTGATNESGFTVLGAGYRLNDGTFINLKNFSWFSSINVNLFLRLSVLSNEILITSFNVNNGTSIRLIKNT